MTGYLTAQGLGASEVRVGQALRAVHELVSKYVVFDVQARCNSCLQPLSKLAQC